MRNPRLVSKGLQKSTDLVTKSTKRHQWYVETCEQQTDDDIVAAVRPTAPAEPASAAPSDEEEEEEGDSTSQGVHGYGGLRQ